MTEIVVAGGCFWGVEEFMSRKPGVLETEVGYANSKEENPDYRRVCTGITGCAEAVRIEFDENILPVEKLLQAFFSVIDPTVVNRQGPDVGTQYRTGLYYADAEQKEAFLRAKEDVQRTLSVPVVTEVRPLENFWPAEEYHQKYLKKNPGGYCHIPLDR